jgi:midasin
MICRHLYPADQEMVQKMISFNEIIRDSTMVSRTIGREGSPWEFNLRDLFRWFKLLSARNGLEITDHPVEYLRLVYTQRFRNKKDRQAVIDAFVRVFDVSTESPRPQATITPSHYQVGHSLVTRASNTSVQHPIIHQHLGLAESVLKCIEMGWLVILSGESGSGKRGLLRAIADGAGRSLGEFAMHPGVDTSEILGSFEQQDIGRMVDDAFAALHNVLSRSFLADPHAESAIEQLKVAATAIHSAPEDEGVIQTFVTLGRQAVMNISGADSTKAQIALDHLAKSGIGATGFAWNDGELLTAIRNGGWFVLSNANLCSPSVLDRLNSLCETNGVLVLSEKGSSTGTPETITPHPDFRLFMTYDPRHGELSRAMRNRGVELCVERPNSVVKQSSVTALADNALLRSIAGRHGSQHDTWSASHLSNHIVSQPAEAMSLLARYGRLDQQQQSYESIIRFACDPSVSATRTAEIGATGLSQILVSFGPISCRVADHQPIDPSMNVNLSAIHPYTIFGAVQLLLRNLHRSKELQVFLAQPENAKSILTLSSRTASGRSRVKMAGSEMWSLISGLRSLIADRLPAILGFEDQAPSPVST